MSSTLRLNGNNRDSIGTTDSTASEEDLIPPPLPAKLRSEGDYCNLPDTETPVQPPSPTIQHVRDKVRNIYLKNLLFLKINLR